MDIRTIIYMDASNDSKVLVTESVDDVKKLVEHSTQAGQANQQSQINKSIAKGNIS